MQYNVSRSPLNPDRWVVEVKIGRKWLFIGVYDSEDEAYSAATTYRKT